MAKVFESAEELIGNTPLVHLGKIEKETGVNSHLYGKLESANLTGSVKDRIALNMIVDAEKKGILKPGSTIIEPTSGNTGIGLSAVGVAKGYRVVIVMPETMSVERRALVKSYGAEIVITEGAKGMKGAIAKAHELNDEIENSWIAGQFENPANWQAHYETTGPELYDALDGKVDILVSGVGTGGTVTGAGKYLREKNPSVELIAVEPEASPVISGGQPGPHKIQGIGPGFVADVLDKDILNEILLVSNEDAISAAKELSRVESLSVGISSGAALSAGLKVAKRPENDGKNIVIILPDSGDRYLSTDLFKEE